MTERIPRTHWELREALGPEGWAIIKRFQALQQEAYSIMIDRQEKYGPHNISAAGFDGVLVRLGDKLARLKRGTADHSDESAKDTLFDVANYALIAAMVLEGSWPKPPEPKPETRAEEIARHEKTIQLAQLRIMQLKLQAATGDPEPNTPGLVIETDDLTKMK